jgi:response regulator of citrate/malate metabolism
VETATPVANGAGPAVAPVEPSALDQIKARARQELAELLAPLTARRAQLEAELAAIVTQEQEIHRTRAALDGSPSVEVKRKSKSSVGKGQHDPSQKTLDDVYAIFARAGKDLTCGEVGNLAGLSRTTVMRCVQILRDNERLRLVGTRKEADDTRVGGRGSNAYVVMP